VLLLIFAETFLRCLGHALFNFGLTLVRCEHRLHKGLVSALSGFSHFLVDELFNFLAERLAITFSFHLHRECFFVTDLDFLSIDEFGGDLRHQFQSINSMEHS